MSQNNEPRAHETYLEWYKAHGARLRRIHELESEIAERKSTTTADASSEETASRGTSTAQGTRSSEGKAGRHPRTKPEPNASSVEMQQADSEPTSVQARLDRIAEQARQYPEMAFTTLAHHLDTAMLRYAYERLNPRSTPGVDRMTWRGYQRDLNKNLQELHNRLINRTYEPLPVRRVMIPKGKNQVRALGIPALEDKIVAKAVQLLLEQIYEQDFSPSSYGFRPQRSCHLALHDLRQQMLDMGITRVLDCDISAFFDNLRHNELLNILRKRVKDGSILHLIKLWLKAGIMDGKDLIFPTQGSPQGSVISPLLANIYLHEVLDEWIQTVVAAHCLGRLMFIRYADDFVIGCTEAADIPRIQTALIGRFARYGLRINVEKTNVVEFQRPRRGPPGKPPTTRPGTFSFLGFVHYWGQTKRGGYTIKRKIQGKRIARCCSSIWRWCRDQRHIPTDKQYITLRSKLGGMYRYFGLQCNWDALNYMRYRTYRAWRYWLNRRGGRRMTWKTYKRFMDAHPLPVPSITQPWV